MGKKSITPDEFVAHADQVLRRIEMYARSGDKAISESQINFMMRRIRRMQEIVANKQLPPVEDRNKELTYMIADSWPLSHSLSAAISKLEAEYCRL